MSIDTMSFILGGLFITVALLGGGIEVRELKIPSVGRISRLLSFIVGAVFIGLAIFLNPANNTHSSASDTENKTVTPPLAKVEDSVKILWLTGAQYQQAFDRQLKEGFYPDKVEGRCKNDSEQFHVEWKGIPLEAGFYSHHGITKEVYKSKNQKYVSKGFSIESLNKFKDCSGRDRYQATWFKRK